MENNYVKTAKKIFFGAKILIFVLLCIPMLIVAVAEGWFRAICYTANGIFKQVQLAFIAPFRNKYISYCYIRENLSIPDYDPINRTCKLKIKGLKQWELKFERFEFGYNVGIFTKVLNFIKSPFCCIGYLIAYPFWYSVAFSTERVDNRINSFYDLMFTSGKSYKNIFIATRNVLEKNKPQDVKDLQYIFTRLCSMLLRLIAEQNKSSIIDKINGPEFGTFIHNHPKIFKVEFWASKNAGNLEILKKELIDILVVPQKPQSSNYNWGNGNVLGHGDGRVDRSGHESVHVVSPRAFHVLLLKLKLNQHCSNNKTIEKTCRNIILFSL